MTVLFLVIDVLSVNHSVVIICWFTLNCTSLGFKGSSLKHREWGGLHRGKLFEMEASFIVLLLLFLLM